MYFLEVTFLGFVPLWVASYWLAGKHARNSILLLGNLLWLYWFSLPTLLALTVLSLVIVYPTAAYAQRLRDGDGDGKTGALRAAWFGTFILIAIATILRVRAYLFAQLDVSIAAEFLVWIGFSYFLLKSIQVMFAVARGIFDVPNPITLLQYMLFLPTLTSGPIYRADHFAAQLVAHKQLDWDTIQDGLLRVVHGLAKKVIAVPLLVEALDILEPRGIALKPISYVVTYVMLYLDFSGYCDVGIGIGRLLGFTIPENFKDPFKATTLTQFWRNWHATLGDWLRETFFIPLGGARQQGWKLGALILGSMLLVGIWHAYSLLFLAWGAYHATLMLLEHWLGVKPLRPHKTARWRLWGRYALIQLAVIGGMFAFTR